MAIDFKTDVKPVVDAAAGIASAVAAMPGVPPIVAEIARISAAAWAFVSDLISAGVPDPAAHIQRMHAADPLLANVESAWSDALKTKFGAS